jgi:hypothetical protein
VRGFHFNLFLDQPNPKNTKGSKITECNGKFTHLGTRIKAIGHTFIVLLIFSIATIEGGNDQDS